MDPRRISQISLDEPLLDGGEGVGVLQDYLRRFGYLQIEGELEEAEEPTERIATRNSFDDATQDALREYQRFFGLPQTGFFDAETKEAMSRPRCGNPDPIPGSSSNFEVDGRRWNRNNLTYGFDEITGDLTANQVRVAVRAAFDLWQDQSRLRFAEVRLDQNPDIVIRFVTGAHGDGNPFDDGPSGVLAHAYFPPPNGAFAGDAHFDEAETWTVALPVPTGGIDLVTVAAHEFGHSLGLRHSTVSSALMFPSYSGDQRTLDPDDVAGIQSLYPIPSWDGVASNDPVWSDAQGWSDVTNYSTIQALAVGNDLYLLARANAGIITLRYDRGADRWRSVATNDPAWGDTQGWSDVSNYSTIQAVAVGDDLYLLARANAGIITLRYDRGGDRWRAVATNDPEWSDAKGWSDVTNYATIQGIGVGDDLYLLARANAGIITLRYDRGADRWQAVATNDPAWSDSQGWSDVSNYSTIQAVAVGDELYLLARANAGIYALRYNRASDRWNSVARADPAWSDVQGWSDVTNYSTVQGVGVGNDLYLVARANAGMVTLRLR